MIWRRTHTLTLLAGIMTGQSVVGAFLIAPVFWLSAVCGLALLAVIHAPEIFHD